MPYIAPLSRCTKNNFLSMAVVGVVVFGVVVVVWFFGGVWGRSGSGV